MPDPAIDHASATIVELTGLAQCSADLQCRAEQALELLGGLLPSAAMALSVWDPLRRRHVTLAHRDYPSPVLDHLDTWFVDHDPLYDRMRSAGTGALRWRDFVGYRDTRSVQEVFEPAGFDEGLSARLVTRDGHYAGAFHLSTDERRFPRDCDVAVVDVLCEPLALLVDPVLAPRELSRLVAEEGAAVLVDEDVNTVPFREVDGVTALLADDAFRAALAGAGDDRFRWPHDGRWWNVRLIQLAARTVAGRRSRLLLLRPESLPYGLTAREIEVLTLVAEGESNAGIASRLGVSVRTAVHHIENIMAKLEVSGRGGCAGIALREGLLFPGVLRS